jgi:hypothetical protein
VAIVEGFKDRMGPHNEHLPPIWLQPGPKHGKKLIVTPLFSFCQTDPG